jgi:HSP20 family protein
MSVIAFRPARHLSWAQQLQQDLERAFDLTRFGASAADAENAEIPDWTPAVDVRESDNAYQLTLDVPGVAPDQLEITADKGVLTIRGQRTSETDSQSNRYSRFERAHGKFARRFTLPESANTDAISAKTTQGVLTVTIPKQETVKPRRIEITA